MKNDNKILITGGAGYIGSHTLVELDKANHDFIVYDNLSNSSQESLKRVEKIIGKSIEFIQGDIRDKEKLQNLFKNYNIDSVIHFAGLKAVGESVEQPLEYYDNNDGTGVRDYIHVVDLADAHVKAIDYIGSSTLVVPKDGLKSITQESKNTSGSGLQSSLNPLVVNIGTGIGYSVLQMIKAFEQASQKDVPYKIVERRAGDIAKCYADPSFAKEILNWEAKRTIEDMCEDSWRWQSNNPNGYGKN